MSKLILRSDLDFGVATGAGPHVGRPKKSDWRSSSAGEWKLQCLVELDGSRSSTSIKARHSKTAAS
jgi:hypothetical protein